MRYLLLFIITSICSVESLLHVKTTHSNRENIGSTSDSVYDFIIVGAGSGGSVLANRLSENKNWKVLLLEAGYGPSLLNKIPIFTGYFQLSDYNWKYNVEPQKHACLGMINNQCAWPRGKALGGTSILNYMIHTRGNKLDYDKWASLGNVGWSYADVLPYFKKSERFNVPGKFFYIVLSSICLFISLSIYLSENNRKKKVQNVFLFFFSNLTICLF